MVTRTASVIQRLTQLSGARRGFRLAIALVGIGGFLGASITPCQANGTTWDSLTIIGSPQVVFSYSQQACETNDIPDVPARAFRDSSGVVNLFASHYTTRRSIGSSLDNVIHKCAIGYSSHNDVTQPDYRYHEWTAAPYTLDGESVVTIIHSEWYGMLVDQNCQNPQDGWVNALTLALSTDRGATFAQPNDYLIRYPTTLWENSFPCTRENQTRYGDFNPTNIFNDGQYYYAYFTYITEPDPPNLSQQFACLMRAKRESLSLASFWEVWTGREFTRSKTAPCSAIDIGHSGPSSVTYNTYLEEFVAVYFSAGNGVFFQESKDLLNWSSPVQIAGLDNPNIYAYPSLLDPTDPSRNFETPGQHPYLYLTRLNDGNLNRDLVRFPLEFLKDGLAPKYAVKQ